MEITLENNLPALNHRFREEAWQQLQATRLGKTILFTDQNEWSDAQIAAAVTEVSIMWRTPSET